MNKPARGAESPAPATLHEGVVVDLERQQAYVMAPKGGIEAVELTSGGVRWATDEASKPLTVADGTLVAQKTPSDRGSLDLAVVDLDNGRLRSAARLALGSEVWASVQDGPTSSFRSSAEPENGSVVLSWRHTDLAGGDALHGYLRSQEEDMVPTMDDAVVQRRQRQTGPAELSGSARIDLATGKTETLSTVRKAASLGLVTTGELLPGVEGRQMLSVDGRHVLASERLENPTSPWELYRWTVYERSGGKAVGEVLSAVSMSPFVVDGSAVLVVRPSSMIASGDGLVDQPLALLKVDLASGTTLWTKAVRDIEYRGPMAP